MTGLEALNKFINNFAEYYVISQHQYLNATNLQTAVEFLARSEECKTIEKSIKALEIIKKKNVAVAMLKSCGTVERYNTIAFYEEDFKDKDYARKLTQEEFDLLKEVLE